jgi:hypothetical protein
MLFFDLLLLLQTKYENKDMTWIVLVQLCGFNPSQENQKDFCRDREYIYFNTPWYKTRTTLQFK